jgi:hypothetical protein
MHCFTKPLSFTLNKIYATREILRKSFDNKTNVPNEIKPVEEMVKGKGPKSQNNFLLGPISNLFFLPLFFSSLLRVGGGGGWGDGPTGPPFPPSLFLWQFSSYFGRGLFILSLWRSAIPLLFQIDKLLQ